MRRLTLVIDAGNTNVCVGAWDGRILAASWRLMTIHQQTVDEFTLKVAGLLQRDGVFFLLGLLATAATAGLLVVVSGALWAAAKAFFSTLVQTVL